MEIHPGHGSDTYAFPRKYQQLLLKKCRELGVTQIKYIYTETLNAYVPISSQETKKTWELCSM